MPNMNDVFAVILGGGRGTRLHPLTQVRSKPAVPIAGKYRLIDIPISNCVNSGIYNIAVLTQFNSASLHRHILGAYNLNAFHGSVQILAAAQTPGGEDWYQGTADAVRKQLAEIQSAGAEYTLILAGDHLYRMDYEALVNFHGQSQADVTVAVQPIARGDASRFGILKCGAAGRISSFVEKPLDPIQLDQFICRDDPELPFLGSMGIYLFNTRTMIDLLTRHPGHDDFGRDVIPAAIDSCAVFGYAFDGYWRDLGTIRSFYETNLSFTRSDAPFSFYSPKFPIYSAAQSLPGSVIEKSELTDVMLAEGCQIFGARIEHSVIGSCSQIANGTRIKDSIVMGADHFERRTADVRTSGLNGAEHWTEKRQTAIAMGIGPNCSIEGAILDKNVRIGQGVTIRPFPRDVELDCGTWFVRDGIVVIPKDAEIPPGTVIAPESYIVNKLSVPNVEKLCFDIVKAPKAADLWKKYPAGKLLESVE